MELSPSKRKKKLKEITAKLSKEELIRRLKTASQELTNVDQGVDTSEYNEFAASLSTPFILNHNDKDVRSYVACCLADVLRIYAPEPPYHEEDLKNIFRMIIEQLKFLENVQGPSYKRYFHILESVALVKTFNVCMELDAQDIILDIFKLFFTIVSDKHNIRVKNFMLDVLTPLIQNGDSLSQELLNVILVCLVDPRKTKYPEAFNLACNVIDRCSAAMSPYIQLFFNNTIVLGNTAGGELDDNLYELLYELYRINKSVLLAVLPQLEFKLKGNDESVRVETVKLLGRMFSEEDFSLAESNKALWNCYLGRFLDVSPDVRLQCVQIAKQFLLSNEGALRADVTEQLMNRLHDPEEKVRLETVITICESAVENFPLIHDKLFNGVLDRIRDKKLLIRREAVTCIGKLYKILFSNSKTPKKSINRIENIPSKILHLYFQNCIDDWLCIERVVHNCFIPVNLPVEERMKRLFNVYYSLDESAVTVFDGMLKHRAKVNKDFNVLLDVYEADEENGKGKLVFSKVVALARSLPEPHKAQEYLSRLMAMCKNKKFFDLLRVSINTKEECGKIIKAVTEVVKTIGAKNPILETVKALLDRACPMIMDSSSFVYLLKNIKNYLDEYGDADDEDDDISRKAKRGLKLLETLASVNPSLFQTKSSYEVLLLLVKYEEEDTVEKTLRILYHVISGIENVDKALCSAFRPVLKKLVIQGVGKQPKHALRCLTKLLKDSTLIMERLYKNLLENLNFSVSSEQLRSTLSALGEVAVLVPAIFETNHLKVIREFVVKELLMTDKEVTSDSQEDADEWGPDECVSDETLEKIEGIKLLVKWLLGITSRHSDNAMPVFRLLTTLLNNDGDLTNKGKISSINRSRLRLRAGLAILKLLQNMKYVDVITLEQYQQLALVIQDSCFEVREQFTKKLQKALDALELSLDYLAFLVLVAADPSKERKLKVKQIIARNAHTRREYTRLHSAAAARPYAILPEYSIPYVVHLLAHHPDFDHTDMESMRQTKDYLWFFLEPIMGAKAENYSFLKKLLENIKHTRDKQDPDNDVTNERLYTVCDIAIGCVMNKNQTFTLKDFPGNLVLPRKLFMFDKTLKNTKNYAPTELFASNIKQKHLPEGKSISINSREKSVSIKPKEKGILTKTRETSEIESKKLAKGRAPKKKSFRSNSSDDDNLEDDDDDNDDEDYKISKRGNHSVLTKNVSAKLTAPASKKRFTRNENREKGDSLDILPNQTTSKRRTKQLKMDDFFADSNENQRGDSSDKNVSDEESTDSMTRISSPKRKTRVTGTKKKLKIEEKMENEDSYENSSQESRRRTSRRR